MNRRPKTQETLADNVEKLMKALDIDLKTLERKSGVSSRMISYILKQERVPSIEIADKLASAFGLTGWQLIMPNLMGDLKEIKHIDKLVHDWMAADKDGRKFIQDAAKREAGRLVSNGHSLPLLPGADDD